MKRFGIFVILYSTLWTGTAYCGTDALRKLSFEYKAPQLSAGDGSRGSLGGISYQEYFGMSPISLGPIAYFGTPTGNSIESDNLTMVGMTLNADGYFANRTFVFRVGAYAAYGMGKLKNQALFTGWMMEPSAAVGIVLGAGWRISFGPGYLYCPENTNFRGVTFNLQIERKVYQQTKPAI